MTYRDTNRTALPQRRFRIHACALCNMMETLRYTFVTHYLLMAGQAKWTDGSPVNVGPCFERNGGNIRDLFLFPIENLPTKVNLLRSLDYRVSGFIFLSFLRMRSDFNQMSDGKCIESLLLSANDLFFELIGSIRRIFQIEIERSLWAEIVV